MKKLLYLCLILITCQYATAQVKVTQLDKTAIPKTIKYTGHIINAVTYIDNEGEHLVVTTETGLTPSKSKDIQPSRDAALYAYHYKKIGAELKLTWTTYDFIYGCGEDLAAHYQPKTFAVTDLDNNGKAEVWLMYKTVCHGDVSPSDLKIIMHQGDKKYAVRGRTKAKVSDTTYEGGEYTFDAVFKAGPKTFRDYAANLWKNNMIEDWK
jgi:hypothetical protein